MAKRGKKSNKSKTSKLVDVNLDFDSNSIGSDGSGSKESKDSSKSANKLLLDNFIALQEAMISIGANLKDLNQKITSLLELFEKAAKNFEQESQTSLTKKMSTIIEQNQTIAQSLILMNKTLKSLPKKTAALTEDDEFNFKPSKTKKSQKDEETSSEDSDAEDSGGEAKDSSESSDESDESGAEGSDGEGSDDSGYKPEPLPDFNF